jgi:mutator protein MutT
VAETPTIVVSAAVVERGSSYLLTRRLEGTHLAGLWEFPGGKCEPHETVEDCLSREILEELGCAVRIRDKLLTVNHAYPDRTVVLHFFACDLEGHPRPLLGQQIRWVPRRELRALDFPPADDALITLLTR